MKKTFTLQATFFALLLVFGSIQFSFAQRIELSFESQSQKEGFQMLRSASDGLTVRHSIPGLALDDFSANGYSGKIIELNGIYLPGDEGMPNLPSNSRFIAIPNGAGAELVIKSMKKHHLHNVDLLPSPNIPLGNDDNPLRYEKDATVYQKNAFYPAQPFIISAPDLIRGVQVVMLSVTPFQYNPVSKELIVYYDIEAEVVFTGRGSGFGNDRLRSEWWDPILEDNILNSSVLPQIDYAERMKNLVNNRSEGAEYLIITPNAPIFTQWADSIKAFRQKQGILTKIVNLMDVGGNTVAALESYVNNAYNNWTIPPAAILMLGDFSTNAAEGIISHTLNDHPGGYNPYISDHPFADVTGNNLPDIVFARITARNAAELQHMIQKFLKYERTPPTQAGFYNNPVTAMGWQTERWFQICSETINGFWQHSLGKSPVRQNAIYSGTPGGSWSSNANTAAVVNYFGPNGLNYIPANTAHLTDWGGNATRMNNSINAGAFMIQHRDHGLETGWGEPHYRNEHLSGLTNQDLTFVWSINCLTGKFNHGSESFTERFHRHNFGALGLIAATEVSYSFVNDAFVWGAYDNMWPGFMPDYGTNPASRGILPAFANAAGKYFLEQSSWPSNPQHKAITHKLFHHHGDAFSVVYSEIPQQLAVNHMPVLLSGMDVFEVTANPGARIALTVNNQIIGAGTAGLSTVQIPIIPQEPGVQILITVTLQNYYRYEQAIECIPPQGPYVIFNTHTVNDASGNANGQIDYGEAISLSLAVKNVGSEMAESVTVTASTVSPFVVFTNNSFTVGNVLPGAVVTTSDALAFTVADNVPNNHSIPIVLQIESGSNQWTSQFVVPAYAPDFSIGSFTIADPLGNGNNRLDPGETAQISLTVNNAGNSAALNTIASFIVASPFITVTEQQQTIGIVDAQQQLTLTFTVEVNAGAPIGGMADFGLNIAAGAYETTKMFTAKIGLIMEDFETGNFSTFNWTNAGNQPWNITTVLPYAGTYSAQSGTITHNQSSQLILQYEAGTNDTISFFYKVSSESSYDFLRFYINNTKVGEWSGTVAWTKASFPVTAGVKTFKWEYMKDGSVSSGQDKAWIDNIVFPPPAVTTAWAGANMSICAGNTAQLNGIASNYTSLSWSSSGTGTFSNVAALNPVYTPSEADIQAGSVILTLTANGSSIVASHLTLSINPMASLSIAEGFTVCSGDYIQVEGTVAANYLSLLWSTNGDGTFSDATILNPAYVPGPTDLSTGNFVLTLTAQPLAGCSPLSADANYGVHLLPACDLGDAPSICANISEVELMATAENYLSVQWTSKGDGSFANSAIPGTHYQPGANDIANGGTMLYLSLTGLGNCLTVTDSIALSIHPLPLLTLGTDQTICTGSEATVEFQLTGTAPWIIMTSDSALHTISSLPFSHSWLPQQTAAFSVLSVTDLHCQNDTPVSVMIHLWTVPLQPLAVAGADTVDFNDGFSSAFSIEMVEFAQSYQVEIHPVEAGTVAVNNQQITIQWNPDFRGISSIKARAVNMCGEGDWSEAKTVFVKSTIGIKEIADGSVMVYPNPNSGSFVLELRDLAHQDVMISITDLAGRILHMERLANRDKILKHSVELTTKGVYLLNVEVSGYKTTKKIIVR